MPVHAYRLSTDYAVLQLREAVSRKCRLTENKSGNFKKAGNLHHDGTMLRHHEFVIRTFINYNILCHLLTFFNETGVQPGFEQDTKGI